MYLENVVFDARVPRELGRFWEAVVGGRQLTDEPAGYETRLAVPGGPELDLCFQPVPEPPVGSPRLHLDVAGGADEVARLLDLGARRADGDDALLDPEGNPFHVVAAGERPLAAIRLESADPDRDVEFWSWLTGWAEVPAPRWSSDRSPWSSDRSRWSSLSRPPADPRWSSLSRPPAGPSRALRHPSGLGATLELVPEAAAKGSTKNRRHLDLRLEPGDEAVAAGLIARGGHELRVDWGDLPWRSYADPSGNELCLLPSRS